MILLLGGGYTLSRLAKKLDKNSFIITSTRQEKILDYQSDGFNTLLLDLDQNIQHDLSKIDLVIDSIPPTENHTEKLKTLYSKLNPARVIYLSTTGVYGATNGEFVDEESSCSPLHITGKKRLEIEDFYKAQNFKTTCLRLPAIYGMGRGIGISLKNKRMPLVDQGNRYSNRIHVDDLVNIIFELIKIDNLPEVLCLCDENPALMKEVVEFYCNKFNLPYPKSITTNEALEQGFYHSLSNQRISNKKLKELVDYNFLYPSYKEGAGTEF